MGRSEVYFSFSKLFDRATCATVADADLAQQYLAILKSYVASLEAEVRAIDPWSVQELDRALEYLRSNQQRVLGSGEVIVLLQEAREIIDEHKGFLRQHGILPDYLAA